MEIEDKVKAWQNLADIYFNEGKKVYIKDYNNHFYFADIIHIGEKTIEIKCFAPESRAGEKIVLYWVSISKFEEYKESSK